MIDFNKDAPIFNGSCPPQRFDDEDFIIELKDGTKLKASYAFGHGWFSTVPSRPYEFPEIKGEVVRNQLL